MTSETRPRPTLADEIVPSMGRLATRLRPDELAELLDRWALRREKVLPLLDISAAQTARSLARRCRALAFESPEASDWLCVNADTLEWLEIREEAVRLLERAVGDHARRAG